MALYLLLQKQLKLKTMKNSLETTIMLKALDIQLKRILEEDLKAYKAAKQRKNNVAFLQLIAA